MNRCSISELSWERSIIDRPKSVLFVVATQVRTKMLNFPNQSRVYDPTRHAVRFWGHDSAMEWSFFVTVEALRRLEPKLDGNEVGLLLAFDAHRPAIHAAAAKAYQREQKGSYELAARDF
jgi:hypothetical protein